MKKIVFLLLLALFLLSTACGAPRTGKTEDMQVAITTHSAQGVPELKRKPLPKPSEINAVNLLEYMNRDDVLYIDVRNYEEYVQGHFRNVELIPFSPLIHSIDALDNKSSTQLYGGFPEDPSPVFKESDAILETLFPKDKDLFLVCRTGNRVGALILILIERGWDPDKLYNMGGMVEYELRPEYDHLIVSSPMFQAQVTHHLNGLERLLP